MELVIRRMEPNDWRDVVRIENSSFDDPWPPETFAKMLRDRTMVPRSAELDGEVVGFLIYGIMTSTLAIANLAVAPGHRRRGFGTQLVRYMEGRCTPRKYGVSALVRERNLAAQLFFRAIGWKAVYVDRKAYDSEEDGYVFAKTVVLETCGENT